MPKQDTLPFNLQPRLIGRLAAAAYVHLSPNTFDEMVAQGVMPQPRCLGAHRIAWDRHELDEAVSALPHRAKKFADKNDTWSDIDAA